MAQKRFLKGHEENFRGLGISQTAIDLMPVKTITTVADCVSGEMEGLITEVIRVEKEKVTVLIHVSDGIGVKVVLVLTTTDPTKSV